MPPGFGFVVKRLRSTTHGSRPRRALRKADPWIARCTGSVGGFPGAYDPAAPLVTDNQLAMPPKIQEDHRIAAALVRRADDGATIEEIAAAIVAMWRQIDAALGPIVGHHGVAALYKRSLHLAGSAHPWLMGAREGVEPGLDLAALESLLLQQVNTAAATAGGGLLQSFCALLASLVGLSFTERLLRPVWDTFPIDPPAQDFMP